MYIYVYPHVGSVPISWPLNHNIVSTWSSWYLGHFVPCENRFDILVPWRSRKTVEPHEVHCKRESYDLVHWQTVLLKRPGVEPTFLIWYKLDKPCQCHDVAKYEVRRQNNKSKTWRVNYPCISGRYRVCQICLLSLNSHGNVECCTNIRNKNFYSCISYASFINTPPLIN